MKKGLIICILMLTGLFSVNAQSEVPITSETVIESKSDTTQQKTTVPDAEDKKAASRSGKQNAYVVPSPATRFKRYLSSMAGPSALGRNVVSAGLGTWKNSPEEWGTQWEGFGKRVASNFGKGIIRQTTIYGLDEALKLDSHYYKSDKKDFGSRLKNALLSPVTARKRDGSRTIGVPRLVGTYTSSIVAYETWYPARYGWKDGLKSGTISLGMSAAFNLVKEFVFKK